MQKNAVFAPLRRLLRRAGLRLPASCNLGQGSPTVGQAPSLQKGDVVWTNARFATMDPDRDSGYGLLENRSMVTRGETIVGFLPDHEVKHVAAHDLRGALVTPGLIDCHTHLVFGGNRAREWELRLNGMAYAALAKEGGGINHTVGQTRAASAEHLYERAAKRLEAFISEGVTTLEIKSGYGLDLANERKQLEVARKLREPHALDICSTLLSAHTVPPEYEHDPDGYVDLICREIIPVLWGEGLFEAVDVFCESVGFTLEQSRKVFEAARSLGIPVKGHMEQMSDLGGSALVAEFDGLSVDHVEYLGEWAIQKLSGRRTVAVLLPLAFYFLKEKQKPPVDLLRKYRIPMAVSSDFNPGTSPFASIRIAMNAACVEFGLTALEAMAGVTRNAARALGREGSAGMLKEGYTADFAVWDVRDPVEIFYELGFNPLVARVFRGRCPSPIRSGCPHGHSGPAVRGRP